MFQPNFKQLLLSVTTVTVMSASPFALAVHDPVLMIPGMGGTPSNMDPMKAAFEKDVDKWPTNLLFTWTDTSQMKQDSRESAKEISAKVDAILKQTGASKLVLVTWSSSTVAGRYYIKNLGGDKKVSQYISFAGPHHGITNWTQCRTTPSCAQWGPPDSAFLKELNSPTEVPGSPSVKYLTLRASGDTNASPVDTAILKGADENYLVNGLDHFRIITDPVPLARMRTFIKEHEKPVDPLAPQVTACSASTASTAASSATVTGAATDTSGTALTYSVQLNGPTAVQDNAAGSGASFSKNYALANGNYTGTVTATNGLGKVSNTCSIAKLQVGPPSYYDKVSDTVVNHYVAGRITTAQYTQLGAKYGYTATITLYRCDAGWTNQDNCAPIQ